MQKSFTVQELFESLPDWVGKRIENEEELGAGFSQIRVSSLSELKGAKAHQVAFFFSKLYQADLMESQPGVLVVGQPFVEPLKKSGLSHWKKSAIISCKDPYAAMALLSKAFARMESSVAYLPGEARAQTLGSPSVHPTAVIAASAQISPEAKIGPYCVVGEKVRIETGVVLEAHCSIGNECVLGKNSVLFAGVTLYEQTVVGERVRIHAGAVVGSDGFGYAPTRMGHQKIYHLGHVHIEDDVEIGANSCIDRATLGETRIGKNAKLDNLVHIGHNSRLDEGAIICGGTCLAGNSSVGKYAYIGGLTGIGNHVHVGDGAQVGALTMVTKDVPPKGTAVGNPQRDHREHFRAHAMLSQLSKKRRPKS